MQRMNDRRHWSALLGAGVGAFALVGIAGTTLAQGQPSTDKPVLSGPKVKDNSIPGEKGRFSQGKGDKKDRALDRGIPPGVFMRAMDVLRSESASDSVRLTPEQNDKVRSIQQEFMGSERAYIQQHRDELMALRAEAPPEMRARIDERLRALRGPEGKGDKKAPKDADKKGKRPAPQPDQMEMTPDGAPSTPADPAKVEQVKARLLEIMEGAPKPKDAQTKVWALLSDAQKPVLQAEIERLQKEGKGAGKGPGPGGPDAGPPGELREKLKNMSPEERQKFLDEMREKRGAKKNPDGVRKPPPPPGDVNVPKPEQNPDSPK